MFFDGAPFVVQWSGMPAHRQKEQPSFERIEKAAVEALFEKVTRQEFVERKSGLGDRTLGERSPTGEEQFFGVLARRGCV